MLIKLFVDDTFPVQLPPGTATCNWLVQEQLPLAHPAQLASMLKALSLPSSDADKVQLDNLYFLLNGNLLQPNLSPTELGLAGGSNVSLTANLPSPKSVRRHDKSPRGESEMSPQASMMSPREEGDEDEDGQPLSPGGTVNKSGVSGQSQSEDEEYYLAEECGWFPFIISQNHFGQSTASFINPDVEPVEGDPAPNNQALCGQCAQLLVQTDALAAEVDRHYKPMLMQTQLVQGYLEKLGGTRLQRWQKRWFVVSEKSIDWYETEPKSGQRQKTRGSREIWSGNDFLIEELIENPDPVKYPKCKETKYFHFGVVLKMPKVTMLLRTTTLQDKARFVSHFSSCVKRAKNRSTRDPVFWKKWADAFLTNLSDVADLEVKTNSQTEILTEEVKLREEELKEITDEVPKLQEVLDEKKKEVQQYKSELFLANEQIHKYEKAAQEVEAKIPEELALLHEAEQEISEEMKKTRMLEQRINQQKEDAIATLKTLDSEIEELKFHEQQCFSKWRKVEEHHLDRFKASGDEKKAQYSFSVDGVPVGFGAIRSKAGDGQSLQFQLQKGAFLQSNDSKYSPTPTRPR